MEAGNRVSAEITDIKAKVSEVGATVNKKCKQLLTNIEEDVEALKSAVKKDE